MKKIELLAPAKNCEYGMTAIKCGADAVYIGAAKFGARSAAGNSIEDIESLIKFAHFYNAKVYVTVNTILSDDEIIKAQNLIQKLYEIGADAVIIQDMGLLELDLPPVKLFASTQTHNASVEKVKFLEKTGFQRVILARELSLSEIEKIKKETEIELETFIHGALCVCYSGQCYLSQSIGGRSGNRGECAQPCRKKYSLTDKKGKIIAEDTHLLSLKDMNLSKNLEELIDAGVTSFKIEGRLKDLNYVKNIVSYYRQKLDMIAENKEIKPTSSGKAIISFSPNPDKTFNRGYTDYFLNDRTPKITSFDSPKNIGEFVGSVKEITRECFILDKLLEPLHNGDGLTFFDQYENLIGTSVNMVNGKKISPNNLKIIKRGMNIYRNYDHQFLKTVENAITVRKISINFNIDLNKNNIIINATDEDNNIATEIIPNNFEPAQNQQKSIENIKKQFSKLGETAFNSNNIEITGNSIVFIPVSELNNIRRTIIEKLEAERNNNYEIERFSIEKNDYPYPQKQVDFSANIMNKYAKAFYERHGTEVKEVLSNSADCLKNKRLMETKHCLRYQFSLCPKQNKANDSSDLILIDENNKEYTLKFNCKECKMELY
ncbi:MAG: U32 family peptidase [bacterium]